MKTMKDYHELFLKFDGLILTNVFEKFRSNSLKNYGLCPSYYLNTPALSWDAMLKMKKIKLELVPHPDMYIFFRLKEVKFLTFLINRYSKTNNKYLTLFT